MTVAAVKRSRDLIAGTLGVLPVYVHDAKRNRVPNPLVEQPEVDVARSVTMTRIVEDMLFEGVSWLRITEFGWHGFPTKVRRLEPRSVNVRQDARVYVSSDTGAPQGMAWEHVPDRELIRIDSPNDPLLVAAARAIRIAMLLDRTAATNADSPFPLGYFRPAEGQEEQDEGDVQTVLDNWEAARRTRAWGYVGAALEAKTLQWNPEQLQLASMRDYAVLEISRHAGIDPEELGVSTTSRTYANAEQRRLDLIDFTLAAYVAAIEGRLSMNDVLPRGYYARVQYAGFLRSDTQSRMETYKIGREVGVYDDERIAELEDIPSAIPEAKRIQAAADAAAAAAPPEDTTAADTRALVEAVQKIYLGVGPVLTVQEARVILNRLGADVDPFLDPTAAAEPAAEPGAAANPTTEDNPEGDAVQNTRREPALAFTAPSATAESVTVGFALSDVDAEFRVNPEKRTVSGLTVPWNQVAYSNGRRWKFAEGSLHWGAENRVKLDDNHIDGTEMGVAVRLQSNRTGLDGTFRVARGADGDRILQLAEDGVRDGFSVYVDFSGEGDGWTTDPTDDTVCLVHSATLRKVAITATPAYDNARLTSVVASATASPAATAPETPGKETEMTAPVTEQQPAAPAAPAADAGAATTTTAPPTVQATALPFDTAAFTAGLTDAVTAGVKAAIEALPFPQFSEREVVPAGRAVVTREAPVYSMNGQGFSMVRDAWKARTEGDPDARDRLNKFAAQTKDAAEQAAMAMFAANTSNAAAVVPPGYRPDLYVTQLMKNRPLVNSVSRGTINDATPFTVPKFVSSSGLSADHVEGTNPTAGTISVGTVTVTPGGISGLFQLTREIVDSSNPAIDAIAMNAMQESYSQQTEQKVYAKLDGANGQGGTITAGFVPSGAQVTTSTGGSAAAGTFGGKEFLGAARAQLALYPFRRFAPLNRAHLSQEGTSAVATAVDADGRPLLPAGTGVNAYGSANVVTNSYNLDGLPLQPTWSMTGNAAGDADLLAFNDQDVWAWESGLLTFRFEERNGPALIDLALFGYFATEVLRPVGITAIRHTVGA
ncbi:phage portal protein [Labedaea rhizosphaerae]|nr:phage portal protein [Labedaea rhizosphaerae]